jgi:polysaccharide pyruvyl transferase WcaK-like protein
VSLESPVLLANDTRVDGHHGCTAVMTVLEQLLQSHGLTVVGRIPAHADWKRDASFLRSLASARLLVINGEGTIHHDRPAGRRLLELGAAARAAGIPAALINTGWEANSTELASMLKNFALVAARDTKSAARMRPGAPEVRVVPDLSLCIDPPSQDISKDGIAFTDNVERLRALELGRLRRRCGGRWLSIHHRRPLLPFLRAGLSLREDIFQPMQLIELLANRYGIWRVSQDDLEQFLRDLSRLELLITGRFHACTLALVSGTPFVAQESNTGKIASLIDDAGLDPRRATVPQTLADLSELLMGGWSVAEDEARLAYLAHARGQASALARDLRALAA